MAKPPTKAHALTGNGVIDTLYNTALPPNGQVFDVSGGTITLDYYNLVAADTALSATVSNDFREADVNSGFSSLPPSSYNLNAADFSWTTEQTQMLSGIEQVTDGLRFNQQDSYDAANVDMVFVETQAGSRLLGAGYGRAIFPNTLSATNPHSSHAAVNGGSPDLVASTEQGATGPRASDLGHEAVGHSIGLTHPFNRMGSGFPSGFDLDNNKYTMMSYEWATGNPPTALGAVTPTAYGQNVSPMAIDVAAIQAQYGIGSNNTGNTTYNLTDGAQITDPKSNNAALDIDGADESRAELIQASQDASAAAGGGLKSLIAGAKAYASELSEQLKSGRFDGGEESIGRAYKTIYDGEREVDTAGNESVGNGGIDEISYAGSQQSAMINLNDAGLSADNTDKQYLDLQREIKGSSRWTEFNTEFKNEIDATANDPTGTLSPDAYSAGGHFSKLYTTDAAGKVTATQDGGYSIANGSVIENATGGDKADTLIGNEHDNVLTGNKGADALYGGHGNDTLNGGDGNDTLVAGRGNNALDGGADFDTASYKNYYDPSIGVHTTQGVSFSITGSQATVTKPLNGAVAGPAGAIIETDSVKDVERFEGTDRNDVFTVENLSGNMYISGGRGDDTLTVKDPTGAYSLDMTGGTYPAGHPRAGESYTGTVSDGTNTIYLEDKDLTVTIDRPAPALEKSAELGIEDAIGILTADQKALNQQAIETGISTPAHEAINHPDALQMIGNLHAAGVSTLKAEIQPDMDIEERVGNILNAGRNATQEAGLLMPHEQRAQEAQADLNADYTQPIAEPVYEDDHSYSM